MSPPTGRRESPRTDIIGFVVRDIVETHFAEAVAPLTRAPPAIRRARTRGHRADRRSVPRALRAPARQPAPRPRRPLAARAGPGLLHDRLGRPRGQRRGRRRAARRPTRRCCTTAPARSTCARPRRPGAGPTAAARRAARPGRRGRGADRRRPAQGVRPPRPGGHPADLDDRLAPAARGRAWPSRIERGPRGSGVRRRAWPDDAIAVCSFGDASVNHASAAGRVQHRRLTRPTRACRCRCCSSARTTASGISVPHARRAGSRRAARPAAACATSPPTAATWPTPTTRRARRPSWVRAHRAPGRAAPAHRPADGPRRRRRRVGLPHAARRSRADLDRDPLRAHRAAARRGRAGHAGGAARAATTTVALSRCARSPRRCCGEPQLTSAAEIMAPLAPRRPARVAPAQRRGRGRTRRARTQAFGGKLPEQERPADARPDDQPRARRRAGRPPATCWSSARTWPRKGGVYGVTRGLREALRRGPGLRHAARREVDPRAWRSARGLAGLLPVPGDPVPGLPAQRRGPAARRGGHAAVLLPGRLPQPDGGAGRRPGLPEGLRRPLPQRQLGRRAARHPRPGRRRRRPGPTTPPPMLRTCLAAAARRRQRLRVPRADRALPHPRPARATATSGWLAPYAAAGALGGDHVPIGRRPRLRRRRDDLTIVTFGNGLRMSPARRRPGWPRRGSAAGWSTCAGWPRCRSRTWCGRRSDRPGAGRRRDPPHRRGRRGRHRRAGRRRVHRARSPG